jgi:D-amino-acid dehydrogenase
LELLKVAVVGAGIVGLATACQLTRSGIEVTIIDRDPEGDKASLGNAGADCSNGSFPGIFAWRIVASAELVI